MKKSLVHKVAWVASGALVVGVSLIQSKAHAIPYFARKYKTTCSRCHTAVPKLNTFGKNFQLHGYQQPGDSKVNKTYFADDKNLSLIDQLPVAFLVENQIQLDKAVGNNNADSITSPYVFHIFAADSIAPDIGFFGELSTQGGVTDVGKVSLTFSHLLNQNLFAQVGNLDVLEHGVTEHDLFGRSGFGVQDIGLAASGSPWVLSAQHEGIRIFGLIGSGVTPNLIHGKFQATDTKPVDDSMTTKEGLNLAGPSVRQKEQDDAFKEEKEAADPMDRQTGLLWELGVYNSTNTNGNPMNPNPSDFSGRINLYFGGDSFIGLAGYSGLMTVGTGATNRYRVAGPDFSYSFGKPIDKTQGIKIKPFNLFGGYLTGQVDNPNNDGNRASYKGYFLEQDFAPNGRSMCFLRYDRVDSNALTSLLPTVTNGLTANYTYYLRTNFWVGLEYTHDFTSARQHLFGVLFNFAF
jgi:hypothetical protein